MRSGIFYSNYTSSTCRWGEVLYSSWQKNPEKGGHIKLDFEGAYTCYINQKRTADKISEIGVQQAYVDTVRCVQKLPLHSRSKLHSVSDLYAKKQTHSGPSCAVYWSVSQRNWIVILYIYILIIIYTVLWSCVQLCLENQCTDTVCNGCTFYFIVNVILWKLEKTFTKLPGPFLAAPLISVFVIYNCNTRRKLTQSHFLML